MVAIKFGWYRSRIVPQVNFPSGEKLPFEFQWKNNYGITLGYWLKDSRCLSLWSEDLSSRYHNLIYRECSNNNTRNVVKMKRHQSYILFKLYLSLYYSRFTLQKLNKILRNKGNIAGSSYLAVTAGNRFTDAEKTGCSRKAVL